MSLRLNVTRALKFTLPGYPSQMLEVRSNTRFRLTVVLAALGLSGARAEHLLAAAPRIYSQPTHESPVRADPDDLLLLPGDGLSSSDRVVYSLLRDPTRDAGHPPTNVIPAEPTASVGFADVVSTVDVPYTLTIRLPAAISRDNAYSLCVLDAHGEWSNCVKINDARPMWISPDFAYATGAVANLPRLLKVIGRNLQPVAGGKTRVRLTGPRTYTLTAQDVSDSLSRHVAQVRLPEPMQPGNYSVQVSRDGTSWVSLMSEQGNAPRQLAVLPDPARLPTVDVRDCEADDATTCIVSAVAAASDRRKFPDGATVLFEARTYKLHDPGIWSAGSNTSSKRVDFEGILIPKHVNLQGKGMGATFVERGKSWMTTKNTRGAPEIPIASLFNLQGDNTVQGFTFSDENVYTPASRTGNGAISLGLDAQYAKNSALADPRLSHVIISRNEFKLPFVAILGQGLPIDHLFITYNTIAAYENGLYINRWGNTFVDNRFDMTDSVVAHNVFHPSSHDAVIASQLGGGTRLDFSDNLADGSSARYLYRSTDRKGFRAAFFWNLSYNSELKLISRNEVRCAGDKPGDGEAIVFDGDNEKDYGGFERAAPVQASSQLGTSTTVTVGAQPLTGPLGFEGQWLQVVQGPGLGQLRKITSYRSDAGAATFTVSPAFDVAPREGSVVTVGLQNWQSYVVDNVVEQSPTVCVNSTKSEPTGGAISFYAQTADSVIDGNRQSATTGISVTHQYMLYPGQLAFLMLQSSNEIRDNQVNRAPVFGGVRGKSGIRAFYVATREPGASPPPPVLGFGLVIAGNRLTEADDVDGAIEFEDGGPVGFLNSRGGCAAEWKIAAAPAIFHNELRNSGGIDLNGRDLRQHPACRGTVRDSIVWHATLYDNSCEGTSGSLQDSGTGTQLVCPAARANSCECVRAR